jgi:dTDP-4-dehydrorhamnose reductase
MVIGKKIKEEEETENPKRKTIVIFGASSFIGSNLAEFFKKDYKVIGTYYKNSVHIPGVLTIPCDVLAKEEVQLILFAFKPDVVIYCAGVTSVYDCHKNEERADALNTSGLFNVAEYCQRYKAQICYISSGFIFAGQRKTYFEMDIPDSLTNYGKTQAAAEFYIQKTSLNYVIFRCCRLYGRGIVAQRPTWFQNFERRLSQNKSLSMDDFITTGFMDVYYLGLLIKMCLDKKVTNRLFQVSTNDIETLHGFSKHYSDVFGVSKDMFTKGRWTFPLNQTQSTTQVEDKLFFKLDTANLEGFLNIELPTIKESLEFTYSRLGGQSVKKANSQGSDGIKFI